jgi:drug/metabolite transporter (DMT)-like permease
MNSHLWTLLIAFFLALSDLFNLGLLKMLRTGQITNMSWIAVPTLLYSLQPLIFYKGLGHTSMTVLNLMWDVMSDVLVTASGLFYFKEKLSYKKYIGLSFAFVAIFLLSGDDGTDH